PIGPIYPSEFIPIAEETGLIIDITNIMLDKVCRFISRLLQRGIPIQAIHVNFSAVQFSQNDLMEKVLEIIRRNHTPMSAFKIEFTESTLAENTQVVSKFAVEMEKHGIKMMEGMKMRRRLSVILAGIMLMGSAAFAPVKAD
ncbi:EAL domain-containing protein, partial [Anaerostipes caccae]|uniref:EAL domain-containing protein n=1 Tax=Anaerostipes caccae TaxID=105841 RepID=UPI00210B2A83